MLQWWQGPRWSGRYLNLRSCCRRRAGGDARPVRIGLGDDDVGGGERGVPGGVVLGGGAVAGAGLEQVGHGDEVVQHRLVGGLVDGGEQGGGGQDGAGLGPDGAGVGFEDQVVGDGGRVVLDFQGGGQGVDVGIEGDLGL